MENIGLFFQSSWIIDTNLKSVSNTINCCFAGVSYMTFKKIHISHQLLSKIFIFFAFGMPLSLMRNFNKVYYTI